LILVSKNDREYRIETGYGLEGTITDARASRIGREILEPNFKNWAYGKGLYEAVVEIKSLVENAPGILARNDAGTNPPNIFFNPIGIDNVILVMLLSIFILIFGYKRSYHIENEYLFNWDEIPGADNGKLIEFLEKNFEIDWVKIADIKKVDNYPPLSSTIIKVTTEKNYLFLEINDGKTKVNVRVDDGRTAEFMVKLVQGKPYITKVKRKIVWGTLMGCVGIALITAYLVGGNTLVFITGLICIFFILMNKTGAARGKWQPGYEGGSSGRDFGDGHDGDFGGGSSGSSGGGHSGDGGFGGGRSGGGGSSGKW
jgi:uncharacterized membrane protein YgcG